MWPGKKKSNSGFKKRSGGSGTKPRSSTGSSGSSSPLTRQVQPKYHNDYEKASPKAADDDDFWGPTPSSPTTPPTPKVQTQPSSPQLQPQSPAPYVYDPRVLYNYSYPMQAQNGYPVQQNQSYPQMQYYYYYNQGKRKRYLRVNNHKLKLFYSVHLTQT